MSDTAKKRPMDTTVELLERVKGGDERALEHLVERAIPPLKRWARGRLPQHARSLQETQDLVQNAVMRAIPRLKTFQALHPGALQAFLRQAVANEIIDEIRKVKRRPEPVPIAVDLRAHDPGPLEQAIGREGFERYEAALARLKPSDREAIIARMELQQSYEEVAVALDKPSANAARAAVKRALERLLKELASMRATNAQKAD
jgi:RNA polymerase sigma-70 factor (ECF subfamily)